MTDSTDNKPSEMQARSSNTLESVDIWLDRIAKLIPIIAPAVLYGIAYLIEYGYYGAFGLSPAQVGLTGLDSILRLTPVVVLVAFCAASALIVPTILAAHCIAAYAPRVGRQVSSPSWQESWSCWDLHHSSPASSAPLKALMLTGRRVLSPSRRPSLSSESP
jgi:hypothetical protein